MSSSSLRLLSLNHLPAAAALLWGLSLAIVRAWQPIDYFWENFAAYWLPQGLILGLLLCTRPTPALFTGVALALAAHLQLFCLWISSPEGALGWLFYLFDFPGALIGAAIARFLATRVAPGKPLINGLLGLGWVSLGLLLNFKLMMYSQI
ncbi:hypothetical protein EDF83_1806 [Pseudomonas protegens]|jgi:hypothetical protein|uniref:Uncharacterized protein n=1 Tax=Pseudomonas protegens (strain DSM 19095 / LMG 27888 / CFBP 6595 / CHA0) TaxID=1124983 RepID=A0A2C9EKM7_PSEPH|nr:MULTISPECIES: hypothetical protein [Pseudomonas]AGL84149.1 hypothetical protein PFLCHA0_c23780 [Pseudomonas protegens CHA0]APC20941.1 hypothetical protein BME99_11990 [Pseudomonas protegens]MBF0643404.1 hypothetical protein [Pseudomonas protegens]MBP5096595.1 hypothetical protein [Pseudomonas protegens]MBP5113566.1 hypothetical protein [Pseudomonas protegens]